jgi:hypothetical protein
MRFVSTLPLLFLGGFAACATDASEDASDGGDDGTSSIQFEGGASDATTFDGADLVDNYVAPFDADVTDTGVDEPPPAADANPCAPLIRCDPNQFPPACAFFFFCTAVDSDAGLGDGGDASPPPKGICLGPDFSGETCGDGTNHCSAGEHCFVSAQRCLHAQEVACLCSDPATAGVCGPP